MPFPTIAERWMALGYSDLVATMEQKILPTADPQIMSLLERFGKHVPEEALAKVPQLLQDLPDPVGALRRLIDYYRRLPWDPQPADYSGNSIDALLTAFGNSRYLSNVLQNSPDLLAWVLAPENLERTIPVGELRSDLGTFPAQASDEQVGLLIARFKRKHLLRIAMRDLLGGAPLADIALELSNLADVTIQGAHDHIRQQLVARFGRPLCLTDSGQILCNFAVFAMGKLGGSELNYSSDIDLMYLHTGNGDTAGPVRTSNDDFCKQLAMRLTNLLSMTTAEGFIYRVDLRLRPEGNAGELVISLSSAVHYYFNRARDWELQMLIKARPVAGDVRLGRQFLDIVMPQVYRTTTDFSQIERVSESRDRIQKQRRQSGSNAVDVKLDAGGIRDVEFLVQCLQRLYGGQDRFLRSGGTMYALHRLKEKGYLGVKDYGKLFTAYQYLRKVEHRLQLLDNRQTHELPKSEEGVQRVAIQMGEKGGPGAVSALHARIEGHRKKVREIYHRVIGSQRDTGTRPRSKQVIAPSPTQPDAEIRAAPVASAVWRTHLPHLQRVSPILAEGFDSVILRWGNRSLEQFLGRITDMPDVIKILEAQEQLVPHIGEIMEYSPHFASYLVRFPEDVAMVAAAESSSDGLVEGGPWMPGPVHPELKTALDPALDPGKAVSALRKYFRRRMLAIQTRSICLGESVFDTMSALSTLAENVIRAAHRLALREISASAGMEVDESAALRIIALGRLGMREFDLGSDADIVFVIPDSEAERRQLWTQVAKRVTGIISSYTADGQMFTVDPRLRPRGRDGELVQTEGQYLRYFEDGAESWEALTYMKARSVAGDAASGKEFLARLQKILWQRFAQRKDLAALLVRMRDRIEAEQGESRPLRSAPGGYYDIDFILLYWRLLHAESFYESLNTPERIEIIRKTEPANLGDLDTLLTATTVLRSLDHGVRLYKGTSSSALPPTEWQRRLLQELMARWIPDQLAQQPLDVLIETTMQSVRGVFRKAFLNP